jgi:hypothetical protein
MNEDQELQELAETPVNIIVETNLCDLDTLYMLTEMALVPPGKLASECFQRGLHSIALEIANSEEIKNG